jgi:trk system potassium uptake protein TrkH
MLNLNYKILVFLMGVLLLFNGGLMLLSALVSYSYQDGVAFEITLAAFLVLSIGALFMLFGRQHEKQIQKREGYLIVSLGWILMAVSGTIPYLLTGTFTDFASSFFEAMSGYTTTGASVLNDIEVLPKGVLVLAKYYALDRRYGNYCFGNCHTSFPRDRGYSAVYS